MHLCRIASRLVRHSSKSPPYSDVIHVYFHYALHDIAKHTKHTSLKSGRGVAKTKRHPPVSIGAKWTSKGGLFLIFSCNLYLKVPTIPIQKAIEWVSRNSLKKLINEGQWEVIFSCYFIEPPVIYAYPPTGSKSGRQFLALFIFHSCHS